MRRKRICFQIYISSFRGVDVRLDVQICDKWRRGFNPEIVRQIVTQK